MLVCCLGLAEGDGGEVDVFLLLSIVLVVVIVVICACCEDCVNGGLVEVVRDGLWPVALGILGCVIVVRMVVVEVIDDVVVLWW